MSRIRTTGLRPAAADEAGARLFVGSPLRACKALETFMSRLIFATHPEVVVDPATPVPDWGLSEVGRQRMAAFVRSDVCAGVAAIWSSHERKARDGAAIAQSALAAQLVVETPSVDPGLAEIDREAVGYLPEKQFFELRDRFFQSPETSPDGWEIAAVAQARILAALDRVHAATADLAGDVLVVSHGAVGALTLARRAGRPIQLELDQPRAGCWFAYERPDGACAPECPPLRIEGRAGSLNCADPPGSLDPASPLDYLAPMAIRSILLHPDPRLKKVAEPVESVDDDLRRLADDMFETMYDAPGIGLAAPQIGVLKRLVVMDCAGRLDDIDLDEDAPPPPDPEPAPIVLVNPEIVWAFGRPLDLSGRVPFYPRPVRRRTRPATVRRAVSRSATVKPVERDLRRHGGDLRPARDRPSERKALHRLSRARAPLDHHAEDEKAETRAGAEAGLSALRRSVGERRMRLVFMGTPDFSVPTLHALVEAGHAIVAVYSQPPRPAGRGKKPRPSPVQAAAEAIGAPTFTPVSFKAPEERARFADLEADAAVVVAYGLLLPQQVLDAPRLGAYNLHASLLPRWRGAAPIQRAIMAGDAETGVCVMRMTLGLDEGPVVLREATGDRGRRTRPERCMTDWPKSARR